ncbi:uncharacterized protein Z520_00889 [Fonsecaea multimorphosa CBS 102226]|uniref:Zn(2)-C6 fungal-type domain-containing protein n=1 Tax=Fonsecaea multimorphosa CBS 102226 TaxID=1442371 RepID=A0A0D2HQS1_9EURO|nr:uncharacterized protein Z520_00889 [Fonsecaea multimorphosa CBS 102226]KIY04196.1 hypothetical protein Z520_00889 [Fonsecaea multimorphosa CBS 102226]OAL32025.1 hypothetical protein AYO22_00895 [Fonsecaea multimorphosa]
MGEPLEGVKNYRKPRRRPAHLRTKTGCLTCRQRKKKCDENPVVCHNCVRRKIDCIWPAKPDSTSNVPSPSAGLSITPESAHSDRDGLRTTGDEDEKIYPYISPTSASLSPVSAIRGVEGDDGDDDDELPLVVSPQLTTFSLNTRIHSPPLFDYMRRVFVPQLVRPATDGQYIKDFTSGSLQVANHIPFFMEALLACSAAEIKENDPFHRTLAETHYIKAIGGMRAYLAQDQSPLAEIIALRTVLVLCIYERTRLHHSEGVSTHLYGAAALLKSCWKRMEVSRSMPADWTATSILTLESFMFHVATSIPFQYPFPTSSALVDEAFLNAQLMLERLWLENAVDYPHSPVLGAPPMLFSYVRQVALMYSQYRAQRFDVRECHRLDHDLRRWSDENIPDSDTVNIVGAADTADTSLSLSLLTDPQNASQSFFGPKLYSLAARLLLKYMIAHSSGLRGQHLSQHLSSLLSEFMLLVRFIEPAVDYFAEYYAWPFYCLGVCINDAQTQDLLMNKIMAFWKMTRNGTMRRLADILTQDWNALSNDTG